MWTRIFRQRCLGLLIEWACCAVVLCVFALLAELWDLYPSLGLPFAYPNCTDDQDCRSGDRPYVVPAGIGLGLWAFGYILAFVHIVCQHQEAKQEHLPLLSLSWISYHVVRLVTLLAMAATWDPLAVTLSFWLDSIALVGFGLCVLLVVIVEKTIVTVRKEWAQMKKEAMATPS